MAQDSFKIKKSLNIVPQSGISHLDEKGDIGFDSLTDKLAVNTGVSGDYVVTENKSQTLTNKTLTSPVINSATLSTPSITNMSATGGTAVNLTLNTPTINNMAASGGTITNAAISGGSITGASMSGVTIALDDQNSSHELILESFSNPPLTTNRTLTFDVNNGNREISLEGNLFFDNDFNVSGNFPLTLNISATTNVSLPASGTLATLLNPETFSNKTITASVINTSDFDGGTASNTSRFTIPKNTKANLDALTRKQATLVYASDQDTVYVDNGSVLSPLGGNFVAYSNENISSGGTISINLVVGLQYRRVTGVGGPVTTSTTPFGATAPSDGVVVRIVGQSDTNTVTIPHSDVAKGCLLNGDCVLGRGNVLTLQYDATLDRYIEIDRNAY